MKLTTDRIAIFIGTKRTKKSYLVCLSKDEREYIADLLIQLHNGKVKIFPDTFETIEWKK